LIDAKGGIIAGHGRYLAALKLGLETAPVIILDHLNEIDKRAYLLADNKLAELSYWDDLTLASELAALKNADIDLGDLGFSDDELRQLLADTDLPDADETEEQAIPEPPAEPVTRGGDVWLIGKQRLICGDCRDPDVVHRLFDRVRANLVITSPPYAAQREYDASSGFTPILPEMYSEWFRIIAENIAAILAPDGSYFLNIKEHSEDGERSLYVKDLVIAHQRKWGWRFRGRILLEEYRERSAGQMAQPAEECVGAGVSFLPELRTSSSDRRPPGTNPMTWWCTRPITPLRRAALAYSAVALIRSPALPGRAMWLNLRRKAAKDRTPLHSLARWSNSS
jgi:hypothetical protein